MIEVFETATYQRWIENLRDREARNRILARITRLRRGNPGDVRPIGEGISELRIHFGPGYRVYYAQKGDVLIILLCGGDKDSQPADIAKAKELLGNLEI